MQFSSKSALKVLAMEGGYQHCRMSMVALLILAGLLPSSSSSSPATRRFQFNVEWKEVTRLCHTKPLLTVNGKYPGPTIAVHEGDNVEIKVTNLIASNTTIHWHGIRQLRTGWADGASYITQCPIRGGQSYTYKFTVVDQRGTLLWHAHHSWQRASVYGALIIYPSMAYPFSAPFQAEIPIIFGEWWNGDVDAVENEMMMYGGGPNLSDAYTINGLPGLLYPCSNKDTFIQTVDHGKTYMLRIINAALNGELFFAIANHTLTVVEADAVYTKPFKTKAIMIAPGQTTTVLLTANKVPDSSGMFVMAARPYVTSVFPSDNSTAIGFLRYNTKRTEEIIPPTLPSSTPQLYNLPQMEDTAFATKFSNKLRSLASSRGFGNFDASKDPAKYNLIDPPERNTVAVPSGGWAALRIKADNPGVWFVHCHLEAHTSWGLAMGFIVKNGPDPSQHLLPPPKDLPSC
ncbi:hypothetical protein L1049_027481 [Liquidambar formosana]|uniref:laccase n=1 Tax=Liquidambar formosana TaxID=63359 RepID=A0AAP0RHH9_LIQFO